MLKNNTMDKSKSYAKITTSSSYQTDAIDWPSLKNQPKDQIKQRLSVSSVNQSDQDVNKLTNAIERLSTDELAKNTGITDEEKSSPQDTELSVQQKSRDEVRAERRIRRKNEKLKKKEERLLEKMAQIRQPKSEKIQIVNKAAMDTYLTSRKVSPVRDRKQRKFKSHSAVKIDLLDLINTKVVRPIDRSSIQSRQTGKLTSSTQCHKGKKSEVLKKKYVSKLKRSILASRLLRNQMKSEVTNQQKDVESDVKETDLKKEESKILDDKLITSNELRSNERIGVQFSRKFRPWVLQALISDTSNKRSNLFAQILW